MIRMRRQRLLLLLILAGVTFFIAAQPRAVTSLLAQTPLPPDAMGGGAVDFGPLDALSPAAEAAILAEISRNQQRLYWQGALPLPRAGAVVPLTLPLRPAAGFEDFGYYGITNFADHDPNSGSLRDYNNGTRTYDVVGYNHSGTDYVIYPFSWIKMENDAVEVVAAADGVIVGKSDGNYDRNCTFSNAQWNAVYVQHADGTVAWYGHLKTNSLTSKAVGQSVTAGEYLGRVGSSGSSTAPHLHFELRSSSGQPNQMIDPFFGPGNPTLGASAWVSQPPYYDSALLHLGAGNAAPAFPGCPHLEQPNEQPLFQPGSTVYLTAYYRDQREGQVTDYRVLRPDGAVHASWSHTSPALPYTLSYWWWMITLPQNAQPGEWRFEATFQGESHVHPFYAVTMPEPTDTATPTTAPTATATPTITATPTATTTPATATPTPTATGTQTPIEGLAPRAFLPHVTLPDAATATATTTPTATPTSTTPAIALANPRLGVGSAQGWQGFSPGGFRR